MPNFDGTGPNGAGPKSGRGQGRCGNSQNQGLGQGRGQGRGFGRGFGQGNWNNFNSLNEEESFLKERLKAIQELKENNNG